MNSAEQTLVIILSSALAIFLILAITATVYLIRILKGVDRITQKAERVVDSAEAVGTVFRKSAEQLSFVRLIRNIAELVGHNHNNNSKKGDKNE